MPLPSERCTTVMLSCGMLTPAIQRSDRRIIPVFDGAQEEIGRTGPVKLRGSVEAESCTRRDRANGYRNAKNWALGTLSKLRISYGCIGCPKVNNARE